MLLWSEEKIGEEIMFSTMLEDVARRAMAPVTLLCDPRFAGFRRPESPTIQILGWTRGTRPPVRLEEYTACYPLEFVGRFVRRSFAEFPTPRAQPRVQPSERTINACSEKPRAPRVGVHWRSVNPLVGTQKSTSLDMWTDLDGSGYYFCQPSIWPRGRGDLQRSTVVWRGAGGSGRY